MYSPYARWHGVRVPRFIRQRFLAAKLANQMSEELSSAALALGFSANDNLLFHTADGATYRAVATFLRKAGNGQIPRLHLCTPYDELVMPNQESRHALSRTLRRPEIRAALGDRLFLYAENDLLAGHLTARWRIRVEALNLPPVDAEYCEPSDPANGVTVAYLGAARAEKGFLVIPDLLEALFTDASFNGRVRFVVQCTAQIVGYSPDIEQAIRRLEAMEGPQLKLIRHTQSPEEYLQTLRDAHFLLLFYDADRYRVRGTGIAVEAVSMGRAIVARTDTVPAYLGGECAVAGGDVSEVGRQLKAAVGDVGARMRCARDRALAYREAHSTARYIRKVLGGPL